MTIDTTVTNGRFVSPDGIIEQSISIDGGLVLDSVELDDVWRTIDASGYLVLPGMIQPARRPLDAISQASMRGVTTLLSIGTFEDSNFDSNAMDVLPILDLDQIEQSETHNGLHSENYRIFNMSVPQNGLSGRLSNAIVRFMPEDDGAIGKPFAWDTDDQIKMIIPVDYPNANQLARDGKAMIEVSAPALRASNSGALWNLVSNPELPVHVTNGGISDFPVLQFLYHEGHATRSLSIPRLASITSANAARWYEIFPNKGTFQPGSHGDVVVFDPDSPDPYRDSAWPGRVIFSIQRGNILFYNGQVHTTPGDGLILGR